jgi:hypothetical protein
MDISNEFVSKNRLRIKTAYFYHNHLARNGPLKQINPQMELNTLFSDLCDNLKKITYLNLKAY